MYLPSFHRTHLVDQMLDLYQSSSCVYINAFEELIQSCELVEDPSFTIARFIHGLLSDLKYDMTLSSPFTLDEISHKALKVEKHNKPVPVKRCTHPTRSPTQVASKAPQFLASAFNAKTSSLSALSHSPLSTSASQTPPDKAIQCFSCRRSLVLKSARRTEAIRVPRREAKAHASWMRGALQRKIF